MTTNQPTLWHQTARTSRAALTATRERYPTQRDRILACLKSYGPHSREQLAIATGIRLSAVCGRVNELLADGLIEPAGTVQGSAGLQVETVRAK